MITRHEFENKQFEDFFALCLTRDAIEIAYPVPGCPDPHPLIRDCNCSQPEFHALSKLIVPYLNKIHKLKMESIELFEKCLKL